MSNQTGPNTPAGKLASSANATIHNGCSERLIVEGERLEEFHALVASLIDHYQPASSHEQSLVEDLAHGRWFRWRRQRGSAFVDADVYEIQPDPARWSFVEHKRVLLADRYVAATIIPNPSSADPTVAIGGVGELGVPTFAPALANAYFKATGNRVRTLPFFPNAKMGGL
jgi:hypothetical protein